MMGCKTIHVITVHWPTADWADVQLRQLRFHVSSPRRFLAVLPDDRSIGFDIELRSPKIARTALYSSHSHWHNLNALTDVAIDGAHDDDVLLAIDGDAFPIDDLRPIIERTLFERAHGVLSIQTVGRQRTFTDRPTAIFCAIRVGLWRRLGVGWQMASFRGTIQGEKGRLRGVKDTCGQLVKALIKRKISWRCLRRTNTFELVWPRFGVYGDLIYHHGQAFRGAQTYDRLKKWIAIAWPSNVTPAEAEILRYSNWIGDAVRRTILFDPKFVRKFM